MSMSGLNLLAALSYALPLLCLLISSYPCVLDKTMHVDMIASPITSCFLSRSSEYAVVRENFDQKHARQKAVLAKLQPQSLVDALAAQAGQAEAESESLQVPADSCRF